MMGNSDFEWLKLAAKCEFEWLKRLESEHKIETNEKIGREWLNEGPPLGWMVEISNETEAERSFW